MPRSDHKKARTMEIRSILKVSALCALVFAVSGCETARLTSLKTSILSLGGDRGAAIIWGHSLEECLTENERTFAKKYPANKFPDFQDFLKKPREYGVVIFADKTKISSALESQAVLDMANGVSECYRKSLKNVDSSNKFIKKYADAVGPAVTRYQINVADYLNGSQTRGQYARRAVELSKDFTSRVRSSMASINRDLKRLKIAAAREEQRSHQMWVKALEALSKYNSLQHNNYVRSITTSNENGQSSLPANSMMQPQQPAMQRQQPFCGLGRQAVYRRDRPVGGVNLGGYDWFCD